MLRGGHAVCWHCTGMAGSCGRGASRLPPGVAPSSPDLKPMQVASRALNVFFFTFKPRLKRTATPRPTPPSEDCPAARLHRPLLVTMPLPTLHAVGSFLSVVLGRYFAPFLPLLHLFGSAFVISYTWGWSTYVKPCIRGDAQDAFVAPPACQDYGWGMALIILPSILSLLWAYPWFWVLFVGNWRASRWQVLSEEAIRRVAQVNQDNLLRRKWCTHCELHRPDRCYHDDIWDRCLPVYDHPCSFFPAPIFAGTQKPYLFALAFLPVHMAFTIAVTLKMLSVPSARSPLMYAYTGFMGLAVLLLPMAVYFAYGFWRDIAFRNVRTIPKNHETSCCIRITSRDGGRSEVLTYRDGNGRAWDQGWRKNMYSALGPVWQWPLFWIDPPALRVHEEGGGWAPYVEERLRALEPPPFTTTLATRQDHASGFEDPRLDVIMEEAEDIELGTLRRRVATSSEE
ncbi:uncharacterized protein K452DRAFT_149483 [Aplosporella prunicola CBS 121167]|uniref:Palmitoyltransferase n=1 Tax=Aplosporella prunicola CBS 121167 TaxID=1176127 RepID=A0A6A6AYF4_9PEZI|nr:uncharacterized protein K452DRAFT_149483 [Aplosporella prunicola CBS 121167]KAF2135995.1 hypothetical protein K452DRAFT_149483 [Aplosporella prunicola CBS 121167]